MFFRLRVIPEYRLERIRNWFGLPFPMSPRAERRSFANVSTDWLNQRKRKQMKNAYLDDTAEVGENGFLKIPKDASLLNGITQNYPGSYQCQR